MKIMNVGRIILSVQHHMWPIKMCGTHNFRCIIGHFIRKSSEPLGAHGNRLEALTHWSNGLQPQCHNAGLLTSVTTATAWVISGITTTPWEISLMHRYYLLAQRVQFKPKPVNTLAEYHLRIPIFRSKILNLFGIHIIKRIQQKWSTVNSYLSDSVWPQYDLHYLGTLLIWVDPPNPSWWSQVIGTRGSIQFRDVVLQVYIDDWNPILGTTDFMLRQAHAIHGNWLNFAYGIL